MWEIVNFKSSIPAVKATTRPRSAIRNFTALSFLAMGNSSKITTKFKFSRISVWITSVPLSVERIAPFVKKGSPTGACKKQELKQFDVEISHHCTSSSTAFISLQATIRKTVPLPSTIRRLAKIYIAYTTVSCLSSLANNAQAPGHFRCHEKSTFLPWR